MALLRETGIFDEAGCTATAAVRMLAEGLYIAGVRIDDEPGREATMR